MIADTVFMVRPAQFGFDEETATSNAFQQRPDPAEAGNSQSVALAEFDGMVQQLRAAGIQVVVGEDTPDPAKPSAVFPNNWISFHQTGAVITYPMATPSRRSERREDLVQQIGQDFEIGQRIHLESHEADDQFLEGTGSMVLDRLNRIAYACQSPRTNPELVHSFCDRFDYQPIFFHAVDSQDIPVYHTNVVMAMGDAFVVICLEALPDPDEKAVLASSFRYTHKEIIPISLDQMASFAGNMLLLKNGEGEKVLVMSEQARKALTQAQVDLLGQHARLLDIPLHTIERLGGGSARCMMTEVFLPRK